MTALDRFPLEAAAPDARTEMDLTCFLYPSWKPQIRPAPAKRGWMDTTPEAFAYRCLPLDIANAHGWEVLSPCDFEATWAGQPGLESVSITLLSEVDEREAPVSLFGQGTITFHVMGLMRTPPGWSLWVGGSPNFAKDGIQALTGIVETDWSPFTFTMNWRFTRPCTVRFRKGEPICFFFPVQRTALEAFKPRFAPIESAPKLKAGFEAWSSGRDAFQKKVVETAPATGSEKWQKHYYRGVDTENVAHVDDHRSKLRLADFAARPGDLPRPPEDLVPVDAPTARTGVCPVRGVGAQSSLETRLAAAELALKKRDWLLQMLEAHKALAPSLTSIDYCEGLGADEFLERHYALNRPVVLGGEMKGWPALKRWTPAYLKKTVGPAVIEYQGERSRNPAFELEKDPHRREAPFGAFIDLIAREGAGNDAYMTAYNAGRNSEALKVLQKDIRPLDRFLTEGEGMMWIGPAGTVTPLHHDLTNNFIAQVVGRKRVLLCPPSEVGKLANHRHVFSAVGDLESPDLDPRRFPGLADLKVYPVELEPGDILFVPLGWWHQVRALDFSITLTYTNFIWPNDGHQGYPSK